MTIKAKDISGLLGEEKETPILNSESAMLENLEVIGYNQHRAEIGEKELGLDKDKINKIAWDILEHKYSFGTSADYSNAIAQALCDNEHNLIVVKE